MNGRQPIFMSGRVVFAGLLLEKCARECDMGLCFQKKEFGDPELFFI